MKNNKTVTNFKPMIKLLPIILMAAIFSSCTEKMDIELDEDYARLVAEGVITNEVKAHKIELSKTTGFFNSEPAQRISGAIVTLDDGNNTDTLQEMSQQKGTYATEETYRGVPGRSYELHIILPEAVSGEKEYHATCKMPPERYLDSINVAYKQRWEAWEVQAYATEPPTTDFYRFDIIKNGELITDTINEPFVTDDILFNGQYTNGIAAGYLQVENPQEIVEPGDTITLRLSSITEEYFTFLFDVIDETGFNSPLFDGPPANIRGNISNGAIGFFAATAVDYSTTTFTGDKVD
jgi:hypothetical protein